MTRQVPAKHWEEFLRVFTRMNRGRKARLEVTAPLGEGGPLLEEGEPLRCVTLRPNGSRAPAITIMLGDPDGPGPRLEHVITDPARLILWQANGGGTAALEIASAEGDKTTLLFDEKGATAAPPRRVFID